MNIQVSPRSGLGASASPVLYTWNCPSSPHDGRAAGSTIFSISLGGFGGKNKFTGWSYICKGYKRSLI